MTSRRLCIGVLAPEDSRRRGPGWSATTFYMAAALQRHAGDVVRLQCSSPVQRLGRVANWTVRDVLGRSCDFNNTWLQARDWSRIAARQLRGVDVVLATSQAVLIALLDAEVPIVYTTDATFELVKDYYPFYSRLPRWNARAAEAIERRALQRAAVVVYPSAWAAESARHHYGVQSQRIRVVPYGANLESAPPFRVATAPRPRDTWRLLFMGTDWLRKGGPIAFRTLCTLRHAGIDAQLTVVGCEPPPDVHDGHMRVIAHLDKERESDRVLLDALLRESHVLLLPTRADCSPHVFCEASAYGVPSVTTDTGGVRDTVVDGENGVLLPHSAGPAAYATVIAGLLRDPARYQELVVRSRRKFEAELNWDAWGRRMHGLLQGAVAQSTTTPVTHRAVAQTTTTSALQGVSGGNAP